MSAKELWIGPESHYGKLEGGNRHEVGLGEVSFGRRVKEGIPGQGRGEALGQSGECARRLSGSAVRGPDCGKCYSQA